MTTEDKQNIIAIIRMEQDSILKIETKIKEKKEKVDSNSNKSK